jgi:hypothetical protein
MTIEENRVVYDEGKLLQKSDLSVGETYRQPSRRGIYYCSTMLML